MNRHQVVRAARGARKLLYRRRERARGDVWNHAGAEILAAARGATEIGDRATAIKTAIAALAPGDVLVIAGKGHETGQYIKGEVHPFSDRQQAVADALALGGRAA